jgi:putative Mn2+ efflux pump MntP
MGYLGINTRKNLAGDSPLDAIGLIVIGMAVFDVSRFLLEEEVFKSSDVKSPAKQRSTLLKFLVIISIAVNLEALVFIFDAAKKDISMLVYPTFLLIAAVLLVISLGVYQKLSRGEQQ